MQLGFLVLSDATRPDPQGLVERARQLGLGDVIVGVSDDDGPLTVKIPDAPAVMVMLIEAPHPDAADMARGPMSLDPEAAADAPAHAIVTVMSSELDPKAEDALALRVTAAVAGACPAVGAMLGTGVFFMPTALFVSIVEATPPSELPVEAAVNVTMAGEGNDRMSFLTHGLGRYDREEFYVTAPIGEGQDAFELTYLLARWMVIDPGKRFPTGDTVGRTAEERLEIQRVDSPTGDGSTVIRLDM